MSAIATFLKHYFYLYENSYIEELDDEYISYVVRLLLENNNEDVNAKDNNINKTPAFTIAIRMGLIETVKVFIEFNVDVNITDIENATPLMNAAYNNEVDIVRLLCEQENLDINAQDLSGATALLYTTDENAIDAARVLIINGVDPTIKNEYDYTASKAARENDFINLAQLLEFAEEQYNFTN